MSDALVKKYGDTRLPGGELPNCPGVCADHRPSDYAQTLGELDVNDPVSLYLHIPFCRSMCWYCGCHTTIASKTHRSSTTLT